MSKSTCYVYVIEQQLTGHVKIGITEDVQSRLRSLQTAAPAPLLLRHSIICKDRDTAKTFEQLLHETYRACRTSGEWFKVPPDVVIGDIERASKLAAMLNPVELVKVEVPKIVEKVVVKRVEVPKIVHSYLAVKRSHIFKGYVSPIRLLLVTTCCSLIVWIATFDPSQMLPDWLRPVMEIAIIAYLWQLVWVLYIEHLAIKIAAKE
jgi:hypothetical protein